MGQILLHNLILPYPKLEKPDDYDEKVDAIFAQEHCGYTDIGEKLSSADFDDLLISNTTEEVSRLNTRCPTSSGEGRVEFPHLI
ncbi:unnamed protein product [marine sediment metagenome]|uniref:Uncharacterized protein n=1 Tax=marine sediment metagenome TaxID=412755 RepID=X1CHR3_9ZZZZ